MPFEISWEDRGVYKRFSGNVSYAEYARSQEMVLGDARTDSLRYVINDFLAVDGYEVTADEVEYLGAFNKGTSLKNPRLSIAYVTKDIKVITLLKLATMVSSLDLRHFPTVEEARAWAASLLEN